jgi:4-aminobutyrate aminotransferase-like enzyme
MRQHAANRLLAPASRRWSRSRELSICPRRHVRERSLMIGIELVKDKVTREPAAALRNRVETMAFERGLMVLGCGESTLRLCPPLIVSEQQASVALDILEEALAEKEDLKT